LTNASVCATICKNSRAIVFLIKIGGEEMNRVTMTVKELALAMNISLPKAYELTEREDFPLIRIGRKKLVPIDAFYEWLSRVA